MGEVKEIKAGEIVKTGYARSMTPEEAQLAKVNAQNEAALSDRLLFYRDKAREWRWRRIAPNGQIIGASSESYKRFKFALANFNRLCVQKVELDVEVEDGDGQETFEGGAALDSLDAEPEGPPPPQAA